MELSTKGSFIIFFATMLKYIEALIFYFLKTLNLFLENYVLKPCVGCMSSTPHPMYTSCCSTPIHQ